MQSAECDSPIQPLAIGRDFRPQNVFNVIGVEAAFDQVTLEFQLFAVADVLTNFLRHRRDHAGDRADHHDPDDHVEGWRNVRNRSD